MLYMFMTQYNEMKCDENVYDLSVINSIHNIRSVILGNNIQTRIIIDLCVMPMIFCGKINSH